jgi:hypothetical protein
MAGISLRAREIRPSVNVLTDPAPAESFRFK